VIVIVLYLARGASRTGGLGTRHLVKMGSITHDGDLYRSDVTRHLTAIERAGTLELEDQVAELSVVLDDVPVRLHS